MKVLAVITARGGSKGIPNKNIKKFGGKPLIAYTAEIAKKSQVITDLIVSTDDEKIAKICKSLGVEVPFIRPRELAKDKTPHLPVIRHALKFMENKNKIKYDYVVTLQPTSPFRTPADIDKAVLLIHREKADSCVSLVKIPSTFHPIKIKRLQGNKVFPYCLEEPEGIKKQEFPDAYRRSSAVYVSRRDVIINKNSFFGENIVGFETPFERFIDIDNMNDWVE